MTFDDVTSWTQLPWGNFFDHEGSYPTNLREYVGMFVEGDLKDRECAREFFAQWPIESLGAVGQLGAVPLFLKVLCDVIAEDRDDVARDIDLLRCFVEYLPEYVDATDWYDRSEIEFRASVLEAIREAGQLLFQRLQDNRPQVREAAIKAFKVWRLVDELKESCTQEVSTAITQIVLCDDDPGCITCGIEFVIANGDVDDQIRQKFRRHYQSENVLVTLAAAWAICEVDGLEDNPDCIDMICKYSMLLTFTIPSIRDAVARLSHLTKCEAACAAASYRRALAPESRIRLFYILMEAVDEWEENEWYHSYFLMLESFQKLPKGFDPERVQQMRNDLIRKIVNDQRLWDPDCYSNWPGRLRSFGLPVSRDELRRLIQ